MSVDSIIEEIEQLNVLDLVKLTKTLQEKWGVSAAPVAAGRNLNWPVRSDASRGRARVL